MIAVVRRATVAERAVVMVVMVCVAVMPVHIPCYAVVMIPPAGVIAPIPRRTPCVPCGRPKPIVDNRTVDIYGFDDIVGTIYILIADDLNRNLVVGIFLYVYRGDILVDIFCQDSLQDDHTLRAFAYLYYADIIYVSVAIEVEVVVELTRVVELGLKFLQVLGLCEQVGYYLQVQGLRYIRTVGRNGDRLVGP